MEAEEEGECVGEVDTVEDTVPVGDTDMDTVAVAEGVAGRQEIGSAFSTGPIAPYADTS